MSRLLSLLCAVLAVRSTLAGLSCLDDDGNPVDSWTAIKANNDNHVYLYTAASQSFVKSPYGVGQTTNGAIMMTVQPLYDPSVNTTFAYVMYNDDPPNVGSASSTYAHAKGVLATDGTTGFWLSHSMPNWPNQPKGEYWSNSSGIFPSDKYAQSTRCVSVSVSTANEIADTLRVDYPAVYVYNIPDAYASDVEHFSQLADKVKISADNITAINDFYTLQGVKYTQFAKSKKWGMDLWDDLISVHYKTPMYVETWISGSGGAMSSMCYNKTETNPSDETKNAIHKINEEYDIYEVATVTMPDGETWTNTQDHSKWGIAMDSELGSNQQFNSLATCIGDINRMCSQEKRGGGAMCLEDAGEKKAFTDIITDIESCYFKDPCDGNADSTQCYWCGGAADGLSYPPTYFPTYFPTAQPIYNDDTNTNNKNTANSGGVNDRIYFLVVIAAAAVAGMCIWGLKYHTKNKAKKSSLASSDVFTQDQFGQSGSGTGRRGSFEVESPLQNPINIHTAMGLQKK